MLNTILLISNMYPSRKDPSFGVFVHNIKQGLEKQGVKVHLCAIEGRAKTAVGKLLKYIWFFLRAFILLVSTDNKVYVHYVAHSSIPILLANTFRKKRIVAHAHGGDVIPYPNESRKVSFIKRKLANALLKRAELTIVPSNYFKEVVIKEFALCSESIIVSPSGGIDCKLFSPNQIKPFNGANNCHFGYAGRLVEGKGLDTLLFAFDKFVVEHQHVKLSVVGSGPMNGWAQAFVKERGLEQNVSFTPLLPQQELASFFQSLDFLVFPSELNESLGLVGLEAMAVGTPVIGSGAGGMLDYLTHQQTGWVFDKGNFANLAKVLTEAASIEPEQYLKMSQTCVVCAKKFEKVAVAKKLAEVLS